MLSRNATWSGKLSDSAVALIMAVTLLPVIFCLGGGGAVLCVATSLASTQEMPVVPSPSGGSQ